jgi:hypothetical protein
LARGECTERNLDPARRHQGEIGELIMKTSSFVLLLATSGLTAYGQQSVQQPEPSHYDKLATMPYVESYLRKEDTSALKQELLFQRGVQAYIWATPALNMYGMKEGKEKTFGAGYNVLPIFKQRLNAKTLITTPNSDVIYALGFPAEVRPSHYSQKLAE